MTYKYKDTLFLTLKPEGPQKWAKPMIDHLLTIKAAVEAARTAGQTALPDADLDRFLKPVFYSCEDECIRRT